ncbi:MAG: AAA family ATPase [Luteibaculaceae bacterium]
MENKALQLAEDFVLFTGKNIFLTGKAGTGKTTFLNNLREKCSKRMVVVAPTGVAAINAKGVTIHSFFQIGFGPQIPDAPPNRDFSRISRVKLKIIRSLELLIIDEISMVRADLLDAIDASLRRIRLSAEPFGGVQLLMVGDLQQLPPVARGAEWSLLQPYYKSPYFFSSLAIQKTGFVSIELDKVYRQQDDVFINLLSKVRDNVMDLNDLAELNKRYIPNFNPDKEEGYITLSSHNKSADEINAEKLKALKGKAFEFKAKVTGDFPAHLYPTEEVLQLKVGAQVMFIKNDTSMEKLFYNGKIGVVDEIIEDEVLVKCVQTNDFISVKPLIWENTQYSLNKQNQEITEEVVGSFTQIPLKLAWAITIHKSQGLTFKKAIIDAGMAFAHGQVYVALSRCQTLEGLVLSSKLSASAIATDNTVLAFNKNVAENQPSEAQLNFEKKLYQQNFFVQLFTFSSVEPILFGLKRLIAEANEKNPELTQLVENLHTHYKEVLFPVSEKFQRQIVVYAAQGELFEQNSPLQERLQKAAAYFKEELQSNYNTLFDKLTFESENKEIIKKMAALEERYTLILLEKNETFKALLQPSLSFLSIANTKAKASLSMAEPNTPKPWLRKGKPTTSANVKLEVALKAWRKLKAEEEGKESERFVVPLRVLNEIIRLAPKNYAELKTVKGFGKKMFESYADEILEAIKAVQD